jgi:hypothetical protein
MTLAITIAPERIEPPPPALYIAKLVAQLAAWAWFRPHPTPGARKVEGGFGDLLADLD